ncbi:MULTISPECIES: 4-carboxymuconolactone decarboxylase [unclassified Cryobacterium]|uniref:bifunctional 3-oxoadipate enol-lactonase/4-carboxymuconolactone decarboxylase PcaDC n=1 Tax=unclassified Cryobacterium TaxID=2649013 RepID=UPI002AB51418|nr:MULTISPECIES: 4-carboxymuconolactone decarboxylase [unclassified Cryobacterium]MDY7543492.1 4-carboxymuconolactone decarboxylase [Cryobacterium sp. 5B3]
MTQPLLRGTIRAEPSDAPGPTGRAPLLVLGPSLGTTTSLWDTVVDVLGAFGDPPRSDLRVLSFDLPGHGISPVAREPFTVAELADAVIALVDSATAAAFGADAPPESFHYAGISLGGAVGLELGIRHPGRLLSLSVVCSVARIGTAEGWHERAAQIRASGTPSMVIGSAERWFAPGFLERDPAAGAGALNRLLDIDDESYALCCEALAGFDAREAVAGIAVQTLCVAGELDLATPSALVAELAAAIPGARFAEIAGAAHLPSLERPRDLAELLREQLAATPPGTPPATSAEQSHGKAVAQEPSARTAAEVYAAGLAVRRAVLGDTHVDAATAAITPETADFQDFITRYAWGEIWTRPGLDRRTRSFLTLACLITGGHENELAMHVRAALTNGLSRAEISEAMLHTAIYAGVPAANSALSIARSTFAALDAEQAVAAEPGTDSSPTPTLP